MSYYDLGQTSEYTGNSPWCYSYEKSLNEPTDQFGPLLNTNVKTAMVNPCHPHHHPHHHPHPPRPSPPAPRPSDYSGVY